MQGKGIYGASELSVVLALSEELRVRELAFQGPGSGVLSRPLYFLLRT